MEERKPSGLSTMESWGNMNLNLMEWHKSTYSMRITGPVTVMLDGDTILPA